MKATFRPGTVDDAKACGAICYEAFKVISEQHNFPPDFPSPDIAIDLLMMVLSREDVYSVVAELDGSLLAEDGTECARLRHTTIFRIRPPKQS